MIRSRHVSEGTGGSHCGLAHGVVEHEDEVSPDDGVVPAKLCGADPADNALSITVLHRVIGPVAWGYVIVDVGGGDLNGLAEPAR